MIVISNLSKKYKNNRGVEDINLTVNKGEIFGFLGPNGAGKTTAMKVMTGLMTPDIGDVTINGYSVTREFEKAMEGVGCIIENVSPFPYMTGYENILIAGRYYSDFSKEMADEYLESVGILKYKNEKTGNYSLGMRQRLGIAMAMVGNPKLLILDEPLNGLDVEGMVEMRSLILKMSQEKGVTFFISSHLIHDVELTCNRIGVINEGRLISTAYTEDVLKDFTSLENYYLSEVEVNERS